MPEIIQLIATLGVGSIVVHLLTTRGDREYDRCHDGYMRLVKTSRNILDGNVDSLGTGIEMLAAEIDQAWLFASDDVVNICNEITDAARGHDNSPSSGQVLFGRLILAMRLDLRRKRGLFYRLKFWGRSRLTDKDYRLIAFKKK